MGLSLILLTIRKDPEWKQTVMKMVELYKADLPSPHNIDTELLSWQMKWEKYTNNDLSKRPQDALAMADELFLPNIRTLLIIICTIPVTTCSCKRSMSSLRRVKTCNDDTRETKRATSHDLVFNTAWTYVDCQTIVDSF